MDQESAGPVSLPSYRLSYGPDKPRFFLVLCSKHLKGRLTSGASVLEKRPNYPMNPPCSDCEAEKGRLRT